VSGDDDVSALVLEPGTLDMKWFYVVRRFETPELALTAFDRVNVNAARLKGEAGIAGYRLLDALPADGGEPRIVAVIGLKSEMVKEAARLLDGEPHVMSHSHVRGLVLRRIRFMLAAGDFDMDSGVYTFRHGQPGIRLDDQGEVVPHE